MRIIYKYEVPLKAEFQLMLPIRAQILCCQIQHEVPHIWASVDPILPEEVRKFLIYGTGQPIERGNLKYIGTFQLNGGNYIGHLFEVMT